MNKLSVEIKNTKDAYAKKIGVYLEQRMTTDVDLANAWEEKGRTLEGITERVFEEARKKANGASCYCANDEEVYEWAVHAVLDDEVEEEKPTKEEHQIKPIEGLETLTATYEPKKEKKDPRQGTIGLQMCLDDLDECI